MAKFKFSTKDCSYYMKKVIGAIFSYKKIHYYFTTKYLQRLQTKVAVVKSCCYCNSIHGKKKYSHLHLYDMK